MSGFGALERIRTRKHIRTRHSTRTSTGPGRASWPRQRETQQLRLEGERLQAWRRLRDRRRA